MDGRTPTTATGLNGYVTQIAAAFSQKFAARTGVAGASVVTAARSWFNPNAVYQWYLVISLIVILALVITLMLTSLSVARERELGTFEQLIVSPYTAFEILVGKTVPPLFIALILQSAMTLAAVFFFEIPLPVLSRCLSSPPSLPCFRLSASVCSFLPSVPTSSRQSSEHLPL